MKSIRFLIPYFGEWPPWFPLYLETCAWNSSIDWYFFTDCPAPDDPPKNVRFIKTTLRELSELFARKLKIPGLKIEKPYKLCDFKPAYGFLFQDHLKNIDYWAHGDIDVVYGNLRSTLTDELLEYDIVSMLRRYIAGHLTVYRNNEHVNNLFREVPGWMGILSDSRNRKMDETLFTRSLDIEELRLPVSERRWDGPPVGTERGYYFFESWNTPRFFLNRVLSLRRIRWRGLPENKLWRGQERVPDEWYWNYGRLTNNVDTTDFPYLHFMHWNREEWRCLEKLVHGNLQEMRTGFRIEPLGFFPKNNPKPGILVRAKHRLCHLSKRLFSRAYGLLSKTKSILSSLGSSEFFSRR